jgi:hypothetical protein
MGTATRLDALIRNPESVVEQEQFDTYEFTYFLAFSSSPLSRFSSMEYVFYRLSLSYATCLMFTRISETWCIYLSHSCLTSLIHVYFAVETRFGLWYYVATIQQYIT